MNTDKTCVLTINGGSSSIKFAIYKMAGSPVQLMHGAVESIGSQKMTFHFTETASNKKDSINRLVSDAVRKTKSRSV